MEKVFSDKTEEGIRLIWMQFDPEKTAEGVRLLREAADAGDPDALCFLARTYMGERYVWEYAALEINGEKAASLLKEGIRRGFPSVGFPAPFFHVFGDVFPFFHIGQP